jgi:glycerol kinase
MSERAILAIDQGTTNTKALLVDEAGQIAARASRPLTPVYPQPAWVEQAAGEIWRSVRECVDEVLEARPDVDPIAVGISNQRESVVGWERKTGQPIGPAVIWQCRRTAPLCEELRAQGHEALLHQRTGLTIDPLFSATKMRWLLDQLERGQARAEAGEICFGTTDAWVAWNLTGGAAHVTDLSNASRTQLLGLRALTWDDELLGLFGVPRATLPDLAPSSGVRGHSVALGRLPADVPIASQVGDSHAALYGQAGFHPGSIKATYGTGSSLMTPTPALVHSQRGLSSTVAWARKGDTTYALEGNILATGAAVQWLGELLGLPDPAAGVAALASQVEDTGGVHLVPAFVGLGAPHWDDAARGLVSGLTRGTTAAHLARATLASIAHQVRDVFDLMQDEAGLELEVLLADGGATRNDQLMQLQADLLGRPVLRTTSAEVSAVGAAHLAGLAVGFWTSEEQLAGLPRERDRFEPRMPASERATLHAGWHEAVARARWKKGTS